MTDTTPATTDDTDDDRGPRWSINLHMQLDGDDQVEAVEEFQANTLRIGLGNYAYAVRDRHSEDLDLYYVEHGVIYTEDEFRAKIDAENETEADAEEAGGGPSD